MSTAQQTFGSALVGDQCLHQTDRLRPLDLGFNHGLGAEACLWDLKEVLLGCLEVEPESWSLTAIGSHLCRLAPG